MKQLKLSNFKIENLIPQNSENEIKITFKPIF